MIRPCVASKRGGGDGKEGGKVDGVCNMGGGNGWDGGSLNFLLSFLPLFSLLL